MENEKAEYKRSLATTNEILESIVAFANASGGEVYIGIDDNSNVVGVSIGRNTLENLAKEIAREIEPKVNISVKKIELQEKDVIVINVPSSAFKPHFFKGIAYRRVGKSDLKLSPQQLQDMFINRALSLHDIDSLKLKIVLDEVSERLVRKYVKEIHKTYHNLKHTFRALGLSDNGETYASAVLFFGQNPSKFFPLYGVKCAVFKGTEMLAIKDFKEPVFQIIQPVLNFIKQNIPSVIKFEGIKRYEETIVPDEVLREALLNALMHADYTLDATIYIKITEDSIEIKNGGTLPPPLTIEELEKPHMSRPRNKRIAALCQDIGWIEHWGEGTLKIVREMRKIGLDVLFEEKNGYFSVRLYMKPIKLNKRQQTILEKLKKSGKTTARELTKFNIPQRTVRADLFFLVKKGFIKKVGKGRFTEYKI